MALVLEAIIFIIMTVTKNGWFCPAIRHLRKFEHSSKIINLLEQKITFGTSVLALYSPRSQVLTTRGPVGDRVSCMFLCASILTCSWGGGVTVLRSHRR